MSYLLNFPRLCNVQFFVLLILISQLHEVEYPFIDLLIFLVALNRQHLLPLGHFLLLSFFLTRMLNALDFDFLLNHLCCEEFFEF